MFILLQHSVVIYTSKQILQATSLSMKLYCRFTDCEWNGDEDEIFDHFELQHKKYLREPQGQLYYDFTFDDLQQTTFVLCSPNGLYYMRQNLNALRDNGIDFGIFHIGLSDPVEYKLKLGLKRDGHCEYWGPINSLQDECQTPNPDDFNLNFDFDFLELLKKTMPSRRLRFYFDEFDDSDDKMCPGPEDIDWTQEEERLNGVLLEQFTCAVCFEYIRRDARFCENRHYICLECFNAMQQHKQLKCPTCRGQYLYDCSDDQVERLLGAIRWPDMPKVNVDKELEEFLKSLPNVETVKVKIGEI